MRLALAATALALVAVPAAANTHKDERFGYQYKPPKGWNSIALQTDETWLTSKYVSDKSYFYTDPDLGWTMEHTPEFLCIAFIHENLRKRGLEEEKEGQERVVILHNPYKDYEDFLDRTYVGGGWFVDDKEEVKLKGVKVTKYMIKVEKLARTGPKRIITWVFHAPDIDFALQCEVLESEYKTLRKMVERSLKSFQLIERSGELLPGAGRTHGATRITLKDMSTGTPKERRTKRMESQKVLHERAIAGLPDKWDHKDYGAVLVLDHDQAKWAKRLGEHAELLLKDLDKRLGFVGDGEYTRAPVIRVCQDRDEYGAFTRGAVSGTSGSYVYYFPGAEIVTFKDDTGWIGYEVEKVNRRLLSAWLSERDSDLSSALPAWLGIGLGEYYGGARKDGRKLDFRVDQWDRDNARLAVSQDRATPPREIMSFTREEFQGGSGQAASAGAFWGHYVEASMLVRFLMEKESSRCKQAKGLLQKYVTTFDEVLEEIAEESEDTWDAEKEPETEEEEEELAKARAERWRQKEKQLMETTFERVFADWSAKDWKTFEKAYYNYLK